MGGDEDILMEDLGPLLALAIGGALGSWVGGITYRLERDLPLGQGGRSRCPTCGRGLGPLELVPILSYLWLRGKCRGCGSRISPRYPLIELSYAAVALAFWLVRGPSPEGAFGAAGAFVLMANAVTDLESGYVFDLLSLYTGLLALPLISSLRWLGLAGGSALDPLLGGLALSGSMAAIRLIHPSGMGEGDVKVSFTMGVFLGLRLGLLALYLSFLFGGGLGVLLLLTGRAGRKTPLPFVPFMAAGYVVSALFGERLLSLVGVV